MKTEFVMGVASLNVGLCIMVGIMIGSAWVILADGIMYTKYVKDATPFLWLYALPAIGVTFSMIMLNVTSPRQMRTTGSGGMSMGDGDEIHMAMCVRIWIFVMITIGFACLGGAIWVASVVYVPPEGTWPGGALVTNVCLILFAGILYFMRFRPKTI